MTTDAPAWTYDRECKWHTLPVQGAPVESFVFVYQSGGGDYVVSAMREGDACGGEVEYFPSLRAAKRYGERIARDGTYTDYMVSDQGAAAPITETNASQHAPAGQPRGETEVPTPKEHPNTTKLKALMDAHQMTAREVSWLLDCEPNTVRVWRTASGKKVIPTLKLELLELKLQQRGSK